jgi:hypothetical protein
LTAYARLRAHVLAVAETTGRDTGHLGCLLVNGTAELAGQDPAVADRARRTFEALGKASINEQSLRSIAEAALDTLPRP